MSEQPVSPEATADLLADLLRPFMAYAELLGTAGRPAQSRLVWALIEDLHRKLAAPSSLANFWFSNCSKICPAVS